MGLRKLSSGVFMLSALDYDRRLFDSLIPLPDGTTYNSYLITGSEKTALIDTVDPKFSAFLLGSLPEKLDYIVSNHAEQDHSGAIPLLLEKFPDAKIICTELAKPMLISLLHIDEGRFVTVKDNEQLSLGDKTLTFISLPWSHWPETMATYLNEDKILFSCDLFGSHLATTRIYADGAVYEPAKRYYAEIMMPFAKFIKAHLSKLRNFDIKLIAPSHGQIYNNPDFIFNAYDDWLGNPKNSVVVLYVSMHGSVKKMVDALVDSLASNGINVRQFNLAKSDIGKIAIALVDALTIVVATPTVRNMPHPNVIYALSIANIIVPKAKYLAVLNSYGWSNTTTIAAIKNSVPNLNIDLLGIVGCKGQPTEKELGAVKDLAEEINKKHTAVFSDKAN